jgi:hypothetical protein
LGETIMGEPKSDPEVWFEQGPGIGWFCLYIPTTMKGLKIVCLFMALWCLWTAPIALLAQFGIISEKWCFWLVFPVMLAGFVWLNRMAYRHSAPIKWGGE